MKRILFIFFILTQIQAVSVFAQTVHVTKTGSKYHSSGCQYLSRSDFSVELSKAKQQGFTACSRCNPPRASSGYSGNTTPRPSSEPAKSSNSKSKSSKSNNENNSSSQTEQCSATTKAGTKCTRETKSPNGKCWQHGGK